MSLPTVVIGAGLSGLACALTLKSRGIEALVLEKSDRVGGRVRTDVQDGFLLDRGFQVMLTAYPESKKLLDYGKLNFASFHSGAKVFYRGKLRTVGDPLRHPSDALPTMMAPVGSVLDKARILRLVMRVANPSLDHVLSRPETSTLDYLQRDGFSPAMINRFFRPFLGGIFLENQLATSSRKFEFVFRMFSEGVAALPRNGMRAIPEQLAGHLAPGQVQLNTQVTAVEGRRIHLSDGGQVEAKNIIDAREEPGNGRTIAGIYFAAPKSPIAGPWLVLNGESTGPVNNVTVPSELHRSYAPEGQSLISVSVVNPQAAIATDIEKLVLQQLRRWFGPEVDQWRHLRTFRITNPVPFQSAGTLTPVEKPVKLRDGYYRCSDASWIAAIEGAIRAGQAAGRALEA